MGEFTWANVIALAALLFAGATALLGVWWRVEMRIRSVETDASKGRGVIDRDLQNFKLHVSEKYASYESVKEGERMLAAQIQSLSEKVSSMPDVVVERITAYLKLTR